jgi:hypothetical protein
MFTKKVWITSSGYNSDLCSISVSYTELLPHCFDIYLALEEVLNEQAP